MRLTHSWCKHDCFIEIYKMIALMDGTSFQKVWLDLFQNSWIGSTQWVELIKLSCKNFTQSFSKLDHFKKLETTCYWQWNGLE
jgi:hypothetical protein